jgi:beta-mannanase
LAEFATGTCRAARSTDQPVLLRIFHEMNGAWFAWGLSYQDASGGHPNSDDSYKAAWTKVHDAFTERCGNSVRFVWAINHYSVGPGASFMGPYPGDDQVDLVAIDGYNWGANAAWGWQSFNTIFGEAYCALASGTTKPILIAEIASTEKGGDKAAWIADMYAGIAARERVRGFVWFHDAKFEAEIHGAMDWPVDSSTAALQAYSRGAKGLQEEPGPEATQPIELEGPC